MAIICIVFLFEFQFHGCVKLELHLMSLISRQCEDDLFTHAKCLNYFHKEVFRYFGTRADKTVFAMIQMMSLKSMIDVNDFIQ